MTDVKSDERAINVEGDKKVSFWFFKKNCLIIRVVQEWKKLCPKSAVIGFFWNFIF